MQGQRIKNLTLEIIVFLFLLETFHFQSFYIKKRKLFSGFTLKNRTVYFANIHMGNIYVIIQYTRLNITVLIKRVFLLLKSNY